MSKQVKNEPMIGYGQAYVISPSAISALEGRLLTLVETMGLRESQENAVKSLVKTNLWNTFSEHGLWIDSETHTDLRKKGEQNGAFISVPRG